MTDLVNMLGSFGYGALSSHTGSRSRWLPYALHSAWGLTAGDTVTFYMFVSSTATAPGATVVMGGTGAFEYAATDGAGFSSALSFANGKLTLVKWTRKAKRPP